MKIDPKGSIGSAKIRFCLLASPTLPGALGGARTNQAGISPLEIPYSTRISKSL
ncbi:MAG: hypothetical protein MUO64_07835 [Anaerolineales bacterium]|nr:hypothetical protein [Anaerolineales bacterium]